NMGDEVRVTVIAAGFERWEDSPRGPERQDKSLGLEASVPMDIFGEASENGDIDLDDDDFDVPSFLR
ncbi:MAG TPA: cell division protein FtsZ, partial [Acidimicrobiales bacterium]|nr:cell division protein FtsZ [Acidimicrobiales bacterium]